MGLLFSLKFRPGGFFEQRDCKNNCPQNMKEHFEQQCRVIGVITKYFKMMLVNLNALLTYNVVEHILMASLLYITQNRQCLF